MESWTFLADESIVAIQGDSRVKIVEKHDEETKLSSNSCQWDNLLTVLNHEIDGDISDGISVICDCDSNRHSPMPIKMTSKIPCDEDTNEKETNVPFRFKHFNNLVNKWDKLSMERKAQIRLIVSFIPLILLAAAAAILLYSKMCSLDQQIEVLKNENLELKVNVKRLVELHRVGHDHFRSHGTVQVLRQSVMKFVQKLKKTFNEMTQKY